MGEIRDVEGGIGQQGDTIKCGDNGGGAEISGDGWQERQRHPWT